MQGKAEERGKEGCEVETDIESVDRDLGRSNGHLVDLPHEEVSWLAVCAAVKHNQHIPSVWKQDLLLFIYPNPE